MAAFLLGYIPLTFGGPTWYGEVDWTPEFGILAMHQEVDGAKGSIDTDNGMLQFEKARMPYEQIRSYEMIKATRIVVPWVLA